VFAAEPPSASRIFDGQLKSAESEVVSLVEAMPADRFNFVPKDGAFSDVRTFAMQAKHIAFVIDEVSAAMLGEKNPSAAGANENGPDSIIDKSGVVKYLKDAFAYAHKAMAALTDKNLLSETADPFDPTQKRTRLASASTILSHTMDHYGQMVEYARMNNIVPPASRPRQ
jgi:hypothetical protein